MGNVSSCKNATCPLAFYKQQIQVNKKGKIKANNIEFQSWGWALSFHLYSLPQDGAPTQGGGRGSSRVKDQQEGAGHQHLQQPQGPLQPGFLPLHIVPHLGAHVLPA